MKKIICLILGLWVISAWAAMEYPVESIPVKLKKDAHAVIRFEEHLIEQKDINNATEKVTRVITVFNDKGKNYANIAISQDKFHELRSFSGEIILASGKVHTKISKSDLTNIAFSEHLASDDSHTFYLCNSPSYPFTVKYTYEIRYKNGIATYTLFSPGDFNISVEQSVYRLIAPSSAEIRYKSNPLAPEVQKTEKDGNIIYTWECHDLQAIPYEPLAPSIYNLTPMVHIAPGKFCMDGVRGDMSTWSSTGAFLTQLMSERDILPPSVTAKVQELTSGIKNEKEKVKCIYEYLQSSTRYVSIQLGIGGFQPISAAKVGQSGFGDCKALSNYMKAMLSAAGIESNYAIVHTEKERMMKDFSSMAQANHAILMVPLATGDSIWLECTSREFPFNYAHSEIAGHDVLLIKKEGNSALARVRSLPETGNKICNSIDIKLNANGSALSVVQNVYYNHEMENMISFVTSFTDNEKKNNLAEKLQVQYPAISNIQTEYIRTEQPCIKITYSMQAERYASQTGSRFFVAVNPFRNQFRDAFSAATRTLDIYIPKATYQTDSISFEIPEDFTVETMPPSVVLNSDFGHFSSILTKNGNKIVAVQRIGVPLGNYPAARYNEMKEFFKKVDGYLASRLVIKKK